MTMIDARPTKSALVMQIVGLLAFVGLGFCIWYRVLLAGTVDDSDLSASQTVLFHTPLGMAFGLAIGAIGTLFFGSELISTIDLYVVKNLPRLSTSDGGLWCNRCRTKDPIPWEHISNAMVVVQRIRNVRSYSSRSIIDRFFSITIFRANVTNPGLYLRKSRFAKDRISISLDGLDVPSEVILAELRRHISVTTS